MREYLILFASSLSLIYSTARFSLSSLLLCAISLSFLSSFSLLLSLFHHLAQNLILVSLSWILPLLFLFLLSFFALSLSLIYLLFLSSLSFLSSHAKSHPHLSSAHKREIFHSHIHPLPPSPLCHSPSPYCVCTTLFW